VLIESMTVIKSRGKALQRRAAPLLKTRARRLDRGRSAQGRERRANSTGKTREEGAPDKSVHEERPQRRRKEERRNRCCPTEVKGLKIAARAGAKGLPVLGKKGNAGTTKREN